MFHEGYSQEDEDKTSPNDLFWFSHNGKIINPDGTSGQNEDLPFENLKMPRQNPFCAIWSCTSLLLCTWRERRLSDCHSEASCGIPQGGVGGGKTHGQPAARIPSSLWRNQRGCARLLCRPGLVALLGWHVCGHWSSDKWPECHTCDRHTCKLTRLGSRAALCDIPLTETNFPKICP